MFALPSFFRQTPAALTGLDLAHREIRLVELGPGTPLRLERCACAALSLGAIGNDGIEDLDLVSTAVQRLWQSSASRSQRVAMSIPAASATTALLPLPPATRLDDDDQLMALARRHFAELLPYPVPQACIDFCIPTATPEGTPQLLIAAAHRDLIEDRLAIAEAAGLEVASIEIDSYAQYAAWQRNTQATAMTGLLHIDATELQLSMLVDARMICLQQSAAQEHCSALAASAARLWQSALARAKPGADSTPHLVLTSATTPALLAALRQQIQANISSATPFAGMALDAAIDAQQLAHTGISYLTACGLALRRFVP